jgi:hypothetical protein
MNEFRTKISKVWQLGSQNANTIAPIISVGAPTEAPPAAGIIYICTDGPLIYISTGISSVTDWKLIWD